MNQDCIFCKIIARQIPSKIIAETEDILVIKDINPKAKIHYLIMPKKHIKDVQSFEPVDSDLAGKMFAMAKELSEKENGIDFKLVINSGAGVGQIVFHAHMHFLSGKLIERV